MGIDTGLTGQTALGDMLWNNQGAIALLARRAAWEILKRTARGPC